MRQALNYAFDFEALNRTLFYGQYERIDSFFYGIPLRWQGVRRRQEGSTFSLRRRTRCRRGLPRRMSIRWAATRKGSANLRQAVEPAAGSRL